MNGLKMLCDCWFGFWHGATRPSLMSLVIAFSLNIVALVTLCIAISPEFLAGPMHRYLMENPLDRHVPITAKVLHAQHSVRPSIVILGDSLIVHCVAGEARLADMIAKKSREPAPVVYDMSVPGQVSWEMSALVEQLYPRLVDGILVLGVGPGLLAHGIEELADVVDNPRLGFVSEVLDAEARAAGLKVPFRTGIYFIDNWRFLLARRYFIARNLFITGAQSYGDPINKFGPEDLDRPDLWQQEAKDLPWIMHRYESNKQLNLAVIGRIFTKLKRHRNMSIILLQAPINPRWYGDPNGETFFERYTHDLRHFTAEYGVRFLSVSEEARLRADDFIDYEGHIGTADARERCTRAIASHVVKVVTKNKLAFELSKPTVILRM